MSDLIDREAVMEIILMPQNVSITEQLEMLKKLPSAEPNENIPDDLDEYLDECKEKWWHRWRTK